MPAGRAPWVVIRFQQSRMWLAHGAAGGVAVFLPASVQYARTDYWLRNGDSYEA